LTIAYPGTGPFPSWLFSSPREYWLETATRLTPIVARSVGTYCTRSLSVEAGIPGMRSPGLTWISPVASAEELSGLYTVNGDWNVAAT